MRLDKIILTFYATFINNLIYCNIFILSLEIEPHLMPYLVPTKVIINLMSKDKSNKSMFYKEYYK